MLFLKTLITSFQAFKILFRYQFKLWLKLRYPFNNVDIFVYIKAAYANLEPFTPHLELSHLVGIELKNLQSM